MPRFPKVALSVLGLLLAACSEPQMMPPPEGSYTVRTAQVGPEGSAVGTPVAYISAEFLGWSPVRTAYVGRSFREGELAGDADGAGVAVLTHGYWSGQLGEDPGVIGRTLTIDGVQHTIVGVLPPGPELPEGAGILVPARE